jgi:hypothetical protein
MGKCLSGHALFKGLYWLRPIIHLKYAVQTCTSIKLKGAKISPMHLCQTFMQYTLSLKKKGQKKVKAKKRMGTLSSNGIIQKNVPGLMSIL